MKQKKGLIAKQIGWMLMVYIASVGCMITLSYVLRWLVKRLLMLIQISL
ncbi:MAG: hypothetical protein VX737_05675 [Pseudomonadota bacterium]|nr:hypothetical protein [Pseudomonadota bacterium]